MKLLWLLAICLPSALPQTAGPRAFRLDELKTQPGYEVSVYAAVGTAPRHMTFGPNGVLYVAARGTGRVVAVPRANQTVIALSGLNGPHSLEFRGGALYVAVNDGVLRFPDAITDDLVIRSERQRVATVPAGGQHSTRTLGFGPDGGLYVAIGSTCNFCIEADARRAAVVRFHEDGSGESLFATGLRNTVGFAFHPVTGEMWGVDNGGDNITDSFDNLPPEEINIIRGGAFYGWPDCYADNQATPARAFGQVRADRCRTAAAPELQMQAHSAPLGISFYTGDLFPAAFRNDALVAFHGSWNRSQPTGYKVVRVRASSGRATGMEDFLWGFLDADGRTRSGRPVHAITGADGAVYISDDSNSNIYRISYVGPRINDGGIVKVVDDVYALYGLRLRKEGGGFRVFGNGVSLETLFEGENQVNFRLPGDLKGDVAIRVENDLAADEQVIRVE